MKPVFLFEGILNLISLIFMVYLYFILDRKRAGIKNVFAALAFFSGTLFMLYAAWAFQLLPSSDSEAILFSSVFLVAKTILFIVALSYLSGEKNMIYLLIVYLFLVFSAQLSFRDFFLILDFSSYLLLFLGFMHLGSTSSQMLLKAGLYGGMYSVFSIIAVIAGFLVNISYALITDFMGAFLIVSMYYLSQHLSRTDVFPLEKRDTLFRKALAALRQFFSLVIAIVISMVCVISVHEMGHSLAASFYNCEVNKAVIFDANNSPHTELVCASMDNSFILLSGLFLPVVLGMLLLMLGERFLVDLSYLIIGFSFYFSNRDLADLIMSRSFTFILTFVSFVFLFLGIKGLVTYMFVDRTAVS